jgi:hypothetical protein
VSLISRSGLMPFMSCASNTGADRELRGNRHGLRRSALLAARLQKPRCAEEEAKCINATNAHRCARRAVPRSGPGGTTPSGPSGPGLVRSRRGITALVLGPGSSVGSANTTTKSTGSSICSRPGLQGQASTQNQRLPMSG